MRPQWAAWRGASLGDRSGNLKGGGGRNTYFSSSNNTPRRGKYRGEPGIAKDGRRNLNHAAGEGAGSRAKSPRKQVQTKGKKGCSGASLQGERGLILRNPAAQCGEKKGS